MANRAIPSLSRLLAAKLRQAKGSARDLLLPASAKQSEEEFKRKLKRIWGFSIVAATFASVCDELRPSKQASRRERKLRR